MKATKGQRRNAVNYIGNALVRLTLHDDEQAAKHLQLAFMTLAPPAEPEPAKVECDDLCHSATRGTLLTPPTWYYCPRCGVRLPEA